MSLLKSQKRRGGPRIKDIKVATQNEILVGRATVVQREARMMLRMLAGPCVPSPPPTNAGRAHLSDRRNRKNTKKKKKLKKDV